MPVITRSMSRKGVVSSVPFTFSANVDEFLQRQKKEFVADCQRLMDITYTKPNGSVAHQRAIGDFFQYLMDSPYTRQCFASNSYFKETVREKAYHFLLHRLATDHLRRLCATVIRTYGWEV